MPHTTKKFDKQKREEWLAAIQSMTPDVNPRAVRLMDELRLIAHSLYQIGELSLAASGLSYAKYRLLMGLFFHEKFKHRSQMNPSEISEHQGTSRNTISALIRDLEEDGLLERSLDPDDRRKFNIGLTEKGRELVHAHVSSHFRTVGACFDVLDESEQETLSHLLVKLSTSVFEAHERLAE